MHLARSRKVSRLDISRRKPPGTGRGRFGRLVLELEKADSRHRASLVCIRPLPVVEDLDGIPHAFGDKAIHAGALAGCCGTAISRPVRPSTAMTRLVTGLPPSTA